MKRVKFPAKECAIYPGRYIPPIEIKTTKSRSKFNPESTSTQPLVNMDEFVDHYELQVVIPGIKKENILVSVFKNCLAIMVFNKKPPRKKGVQNKIHEFSGNFLEKQIILPDNTDTAFIKAEYSNGILMLNIPKGNQQDEKEELEIVIY